ncbi:MAG: elongation factor G [Planctomycetes bacterium]|nr:elongation factor G [Planctomycetota bacterium]
MSVSPASIRNIAFVGHPSAGKTTLVDALAHALGASERKGSVADKTSICDTEPEEQEKGHTLQLKTVHAKQGGLLYNLQDTPGYPDFVAEALSAIYGSDLVIGVVSASSGVTFNLRKKLELASELHRGRAVVITHLDDPNADFDALVDKLQAALGPQCVPFELPDGSASGFHKVTNVLAGGAEEYKRQLMDRVMDGCEDGALLERYLETEKLSDEELHTHLPAAIEKGTLVPILVCNPVSGLGLPEILEFLREYAPSPETLPSFKLKDGGAPIPLDPAGELLGIVFNVRSDPHVGKICLARVLRGTIRASDHVEGPRANGKGEKPGGLFYLVGGKKREPTDSASAGEIVAFSKVDGLKLGDSFSVAGHKAPAVEFPRYPSAMFSLAVTPKSRNDEQKIGDALHKLEAEDPTFRVEQVAATHELVIHGMSELHLKVIEARLKRRYGVEITTALPRIAYLETVTRPADASYRHKKQTGGRGQFGECHLRVRPGAKDSGVVFVDNVVGGSIPRNLIPAVEKGIREVCSRGVLIHSHVIDVEVECYDGKFHEVDSDEASFKIAGARAFKDAFQKAHPVLMEPVMEVQIRTPTDAAGAVFSDVTSHRRGHVLDQITADDGHVTLVTAHIPLSALLTYHRDLKSQTAGEGDYSMKLAHYAPVPVAEQGKIVAALGHKHAEED